MIRRVDTEELEQRLEAATETTTFDIKAEMPWSDKSFAKDILAMANMQDGGYILIGVEDGTFKRQGVPPDVRATYKIDTMRDQMAKWADPHVDFSVSFPQDRGGMTYVVIHVRSFREVPVICKSDGADVFKGKLYYRTTNEKVQSAVINNSYDMRDLILTATLRMRAKLLGLGIPLPDTDSDLMKFYDTELGDL